MDPREHLIVALDVGGLQAAKTLVDRIGDEVLWYKVGLELYAASGPAAVKMLQDRGKRVFLDLKLHDIPNTVARASAQLAELGVDIIDLHVAAGSEAMARASAAVREVCPGENRPTLLGVTVLTRAAVDAAGQPLSPGGLIEEVSRRAQAAQEAGLDGVVCPARAAESVKARCSAEFAVLVPGIRPEGAEKGDQHWVATPKWALGAGARWLVVGRPVHAAPDPRVAAAAICREIATALV